MIFMPTPSGSVAKPRQFWLSSQGDLLPQICLCEILLLSVLSFSACSDDNSSCCSSFVSLVEECVQAVLTCSFDTFPAFFHPTCDEFQHEKFLADSVADELLEICPELLPCAFPSK